MTYPLVRDLATDRIPVVVTCGVLGFSPQGYYRWLDNPVSDRDWTDAHLVNAMMDIHADDPEFGYRFIADELARAGHRVGINHVQRLCCEHGIWSTTTRRDAAMARSRAHRSTTTWWKGSSRWMPSTGCG
jgi:hypothetical protein